MVTARDVERTLVQVGCSAVKLDTINRQLRGKGQLATGGRGRHGAKVTSEEVAGTLLAYGGTAKAVRGADRLAKLGKLTSPGSEKTLVTLIKQVIEDPSGFIELRISRIRLRAELLFQNDVRIVFSSKRSASARGRLEVETVFDQDFFLILFNLLRDGCAAVAHVEDEEEVE